MAFLDRIKGCLVGANVGDCLGSFFEGDFWDCTIDILQIIHKIGIKKIAKKENESIQFTDDTAMSKSVCSSLLTCKEFNAVDMATRFTKEYEREGWRGYGGGVTDVFKFWRDKGIKKQNVFKQATHQFEGSGSYGNGAAMRVAPVAVFAKSKTHCIQIAKQSAQLTHSHRCGYTGAILQALAVYQALHSTSAIDPFAFLKNLKEDISALEETTGVHEEEVTALKTSDDSDTGDFDAKLEKLHEWTCGPSFTFTKQLGTIEDLLRIHSTEIDTATVVTKLGNGISAQEAVPAALYSFLRNINNTFEETLYYTISLGGDTDTIGSMCAAIAGAYQGFTNIPPEWVKACEGCQEMIVFADRFNEET
ncbi:ADP-ribosylhydrolase ARH3-like [Hydractinia symbiolongicarpus]|uniref:ADP-ribosylhydrolase ARH3-like n=1 Tax=Hydractinia symbiolongicarpus TaxID=13093 RepID=UPI00254C2C70|nr:ADP-ribosylhydrolase ARH3-like [Hydractinia symbiolongicarpus]